MPLAAARVRPSSRRRATRNDGRLLLLETILDPSIDPAHSMMDILMMVLTGGRERTEAEFGSLLRAAGFALTAVVPTPGHSILECRPVESTILTTGSPPHFHRSESCLSVRERSR
jgi:hypothetical protein